MKVEVTKFDSGNQIKIINNSEEIKKKMFQNIIDALNAVGSYVEGQARKTLATEKINDLGGLTASLTHDIEPLKGKVRVGSPLKYSVYVEKGTGIFAEDGDGRKTPWAYEYKGRKGDKGKRWTRGQEPQPYLLPAIENNRDVIKKIIATNLKKGMGE